MQAPESSWNRAENAVILNFVPSNAWLSNENRWGNLKGTQLAANVAYLSKDEKAHNKKGMTHRQMRSCLLLTFASEAILLAGSPITTDALIFLRCTAQKAQSFAHSLLSLLQARTHFQTI
jgi:hypothetical protein